MADPIDTTPQIESPENRTQDTSPEINPPEPTPQVDELYRQMNINDIIEDDLGAIATIDCQPDYRDIVYQLIDHSIRIFEQEKSRNIGAITPASLLAVFIHQINCFGALADLYTVRETMSKSAARFSDYDLKKQTLNKVSWMNTPPFINDILIGLYPTCDPLRKNVCFVNSYASFSFYHDIGRFFPLHMFLALHNIIATKGANATTDAIWFEWLRYVVYNPANGQNITVANIIGAAYQNNTVENFLTRKLRRLMSVTVSDLRQRRATFQEFRFPPFPQTENITQKDAYTITLSASRAMIPSIDIFLDIMSAQFASIFKGCKPLGALYELTSGTNIMNHYYDELQPPTFHYLPVDLADPSIVKAQSFSHFLNTIKYKCTFQCNQDPTIKLVFSNERQNLTPGITLVNTEEQQPADPDTKQGTLGHHLYKSPIFLYSPWSTGTSSMHYALTTGLHIETSEIDSFHVPYPRIESSLHDENSIFLSSAVPINACFNLTSYSGERNMFVRNRDIDSDYEIRTSFSLYDMSEHRLPMYPSSVASASRNDFLPGFTLQTGITQPNLASTKIAYAGSKQWTEEAATSVFPTPPYVWSSYRWTDPVNAQSTNPVEYAYYITDFRTLYGTAPQTYKSYHLYDLIK